MLTHPYVGNDLVHWNGPEAQEKAISGSTTDRFIQRVLHGNEIQLLAEKYFSPAQMLWALWAAKEAVYKAAVKAIPDLIFSPASIQIHPSGSKLTRGIACVRHLNFDLIWETCEEFVHALAIGPVKPESDFTRSIWDKIHHQTARHENLGFANNPSAAVRHLACRIAAGASGLGIASLQIIRARQENGRLSPPQLHTSDSSSPIGSFDVSLSHDGPWSAAAVYE